MSYYHIQSPAYKELPPNQPSIYLAGNSSEFGDWQGYCLNKFKGFGEITVINPRRTTRFKETANALDKALEQAKWEKHYFDQASQIMFWFGIGEAEPITLYHLGTCLREYKWRPNYYGEKAKQPMFIGVDRFHPYRAEIITRAFQEGYSEEVVDNIDVLMRNVLEFNRLKRLIS